MSNTHGDGAGVTGLRILGHEKSHSSCVISDKMLYLSEPSFPHLQNRSRSSTLVTRPK